jgi:mono/diheme cytochrome c family protein
MRFARAAFAAALAACVVAGCGPRPLPDAGSPGAQAYVNRCGQCHAPYNPRELTASMWDTQVTMMEVKIQQAGLPALTSDERDAILEYLRRNAGSQ